MTDLEKIRTEGVTDSTVEKVSSPIAVDDSVEQISTKESLVKSPNNGENLNKEEILFPTPSENNDEPVSNKYSGVGFQPPLPIQEFESKQYSLPTMEDTSNEGSKARQILVQKISGQPVDVD